MTATEVRPLLGQMVDGRYLVESHLADGGMGSVYIALDTRLDRRVALKVMREELARDHGFVDRFRREARSAARLSHPHIVAVYDQGGEGDLVWLAMELIGQGRTLRNWLAEVGALTPREALRVWKAMVAALEAAHRAGLMHRDVKPENVLLGDEDRTVKVADFGLSRPVTNQTFTVAGSHLFGTASYLSPEQIQDGRSDERSDLYAAGLVLFEMLTGRKAVEGDSLIHVAYQHVHGTIPLPSALVPGLPTELDALCSWASQRDPQARPSDASTLMAQLESSTASLTPTQLDTRPVVEGYDAGSSRTSALIHRTRRVPMVGPGRDRAPGAENGADLPPTTGVVLPEGTALPGKVRRLRPRGRPLKPWARWLVGAAAVGVLLAAGLYWYFFFGPAGQRIVPDVAKQQQGPATLALAAQDLDATITAAFSEDIPRGWVISTDPGGGTQTRRGADITVLVSKGQERYQVPAVLRLSPDEAAAELLRVKLTRGPVQEEYSESVEAGRVTRSDPATGQSVQPNTEIALFVSKGKKPIAVPKLLTRTLQDAQNELTALGLNAKVSKEEFSNDVPKGSILSQAPSSGTIYKGGTVTFVVSKGPDLVTVPQVSGKSVDEAVAILRQAGFQVDVRRFFGGNWGKAHNTEPSAGQQAGRGTTVILRVV